MLSRNAEIPGVHSKEENTLISPPDHKFFGIHDGRCTRQLTALGGVTVLCLMQVWSPAQACGSLPEYCDDRICALRIADESGYQHRGDRCEGQYEPQVSAAKREPLELVGLRSVRYLHRRHSVRRSFIDCSRRNFRVFDGRRCMGFANVPGWGVDLQLARS